MSRQVLLAGKNRLRGLRREIDGMIDEIEDAVNLIEMKEAHPMVTVVPDATFPESFEDGTSSSIVVSSAAEKQDIFQVDLTKPVKPEGWSPGVEIAGVGDIMDDDF